MGKGMAATITEGVIMTKIHISRLEVTPDGTFENIPINLWPDVFKSVKKEIKPKGGKPIHSWLDDGNQKVIDGKTPEQLIMILASNNKSYVLDTYAIQ